MNEESSDLGTEVGESQRSAASKTRKETSYAPDIHTAAEKAILSGEGAIAQGPGAVAAGERGISVDTVGGAVITGDVTVGGGDFVGRDRVLITYDTAFQRVIGSTAFVLSQLELSYAQTREQAQGWFRFSLIAAAVGFVLIGAGVIAVMFGQITAGIITAISSVVPNAAAALFFVQSKNANERVDVIQTRLTEAREVQTAVEITNTIEDEKSRDKLKAQIVKKALRFEQDVSKK
jgi:cytochrome c oxidase subunit IV